MRALGGVIYACLSQLKRGLYREIDNSLTAQHNQDVILIVLFIAALQGLLSSPAFAQGCAMCQTVLPQASEPIARGMFWCILILLTAPFAVCATISGWLFYHYRRASRSQSFPALVTPLRTAISNRQETA